MYYGKNFDIKRPIERGDTILLDLEEASGMASGVALVLEVLTLIKINDELIYEEHYEEMSFGYTKLIDETYRHKEGILLDMNFHKCLRDVNDIYKKWHDIWNIKCCKVLIGDKKWIILDPNIKVQYSSRGITITYMVKNDD